MAGRWSSVLGSVSLPTALTFQGFYFTTIFRNPKITLYKGNHEYLPIGLIERLG